MPIIDTQRRLAQAGRIRAGEQTVTAKGKRIPRKLTQWRLTSASRRNLDAAAQLYGGRVQPWKEAPNEGQWELYTEADELTVVVLPERLGFSQWMELWDGPVCRRRCDGRELQPETGGGPCQCDLDDPLCSPHTRLSVLLAGLPGVGLWRLDTQGYNAQAELAGAMDMAQLLVDMRGLAVLPGTLRLDQRNVKRADPDNGEGILVFRFAVPVLDFNVDMAALAEGATIHQLPRPEDEAGGLTEQLEASLDEQGVSLVRPVPEHAPYRTPRQQILDMIDQPAPPPATAASPPALPATGARPRTAAQVAAQGAASAPPAPAGAPQPPAVAQGPAPPATRRSDEHLPEDEPPPAEPPEGYGGQTNDAPMSDPQLKRLQTLFTKSGLLPGNTGEGAQTRIREFKLHYCKGIIGRAIDSSRDMTVHEANEVCDALLLVIEDNK